MARPFCREEIEVSSGPSLARQRKGFLVTGVVQGVGFRPFVFRLATSLGLAGWVANTGRGVDIEVEGEPGAVERFALALGDQAPPLARIASIRGWFLPPQGRGGFQVRESLKKKGGREGALVPPDTAVCPDCWREILDPADRRYLYPFNACTVCGPRFTIVEGVPFDRWRTAMAPFSLCPKCSQEYGTPGDRRFHAQASACPICGPRISLVSAGGGPLPGNWDVAFRRLIHDGAIVAVKGLGGFHLVCDGQNAGAVKDLRRRKNRPAKAFAVMTPSLEAARRYCRVDLEEEGLLTSQEGQIVLLTRRFGAELPEELAPGLPTLGVMLPYTPLHLLLFPQAARDEEGSDLLVMTSGNRGGLPLVAANEEAQRELAGIADAFLIHDRKITNPCDDSVVRRGGDGQTILLRRSRGYVPDRVAVPFRLGTPEALGAGPQQKATFCLLRGEGAFLSQHLGDLDSSEALDFYRHALGRLGDLTGIRPVVIGHDLHPGYATTGKRMGDLLPDGWDGERMGLTAVQHHHAHFAAGMAENGLEGEAVGIVLDGTGYGEDGAIWGFEVLVGDYLTCRRQTHLQYLSLPGGEGAIRHPWKMAVSYLVTCLGEEAGLEVALGLFPNRVQQVEAVAALIRAGFNSPQTSSCGRLFDAVAAILGVCRENTYDGQAAMELGEMALSGENGRYQFPLNEGILDPGPLVCGILEDLRTGKERRGISTRFHNTIAVMAAEAAVQGGLGRVILSGGVFQNPYLLARTREECEKRRLTVYSHRRVPSNDASLSLGQAMVAGRRWTTDVLGSSG